MAALRPLGPNAAAHRLDEFPAGYFLGERSPPEPSFASQAELVMAMSAAPTSVIAGDDVGVCAVFWVGEGETQIHRAFRVTASSWYGNLGALNIRGPGSVVVNVALSRIFAVWEHQTIEVRAEAFNLMNHVQPNNPTATLTSSTFGQILTSGDPRIMQFALKYVF